MSNNYNYSICCAERRLDNQTFYLGIAKIAVDFAAYNGVNGNNLPQLNVSDNTTKCSFDIVPYFPLGDLERILELKRIEIDKNYPSHILILFTEYITVHSPKTTEIKKHLVCYIELFSTFQYYVILNDNYKGESIHKHYIQTVLKQENMK